MKKMILVCGTVSAFPDDLKGKCSGCDKDIIFRPHSPKEAVKVCIVCGVFGAIKAGVKIEDVIVTEQTKKEVAGLFHDPSNN